MAVVQQLNNRVCGLASLCLLVACIAHGEIAREKCNYGAKREEGKHKPYMHVVSRSQTHPYRRRVWTTVNTKLGSGFHQILGVLIGLSRCYVNDRPLVAIAGYPGSCSWRWRRAIAAFAANCGAALPVKRRKLLYGKAQREPEQHSNEFVRKKLHVGHWSSCFLAQLSQKVRNIFSAGARNCKFLVFTGSAVPQRQQTLFSIVMSTSHGQELR